MRCRKRLFALILTTGLLGGRAHAAPEVIGTVHPVIEPDMVAWMKAHITPDQIAQLQAEKQEAMRRYAERPTGVKLPRTSEPAVRWFDPSITVPYDLRDHEGRLIHAAGTTINPLTWMPMTRELLFFDGDDAEQVRWAEQAVTRGEGRVKPILVAGAPLEISRKWQRAVSFDQRGLLVEKLGIGQVPARVRQDGDRLRIEEVLP